MRKFYLYLISMLLAPILSGCGAQLMDYKPKTDMSINEAKSVFERCMMDRPSRPEFIEFNDDYISLNYGIVTRVRNRAFIGGLIGVGSGSSVTKESEERIYYESIDEVVLYSSRRKSNTSYTVTLLGIRNQHMLRTYNLEAAKQIADALQVILNYYKQKE